MFASTISNDGGKLLLRTILDSAAFSGVRASIWNGLVDRQVPVISEIASNLGAFVFDWSLSDLFRQKKKLFILGSGSSVNDLSDQDFDHMAQFSSIGLNAWPLHFFVPSGYSFESDPVAGGPSRETLFVASMLGRRDIQEASPFVLSLRPNSPDFIGRMTPLPESIQRNHYIYGRANLVTKSLRNVEADWHLIEKAYARRPSRRAVLPDNGASVVRMAFLGLLIGFEEVVLVGIDLDDQPYFWHASSTTNIYDKARLALMRGSGTVHETESKDSRPFETSQILAALSRMFTDRGRSLTVFSKKSRLFPTVPLYRYSER